MVNPNIEQKLAELDKPSSLKPIITQRIEDNPREETHDNDTQRENSKNDAKLEPEMIPELRSKYSAATQEIENIKKEYEEKIQELMLQIDNFGLDKEYAETQAEVAQAELQNMQAQLEALEAEKDAILQQKALGNNEVSEIVTENGKLKDAILKLRDINVRDKQEFQLQVLQLKKEIEKYKQIEGNKSITTIFDICNRKSKKS